MSSLVVLRHGQSMANAEDVFGGWLDAPLTKQGRREARNAGYTLAGMHPDAVHTSVLARATETARVVIDAAGWDMSPNAYWRLNERHYGALQGMNKDDARRRFGTTDVERWRRGIEHRPPLACHGQLIAQQADPRYAQIPEAARIAAESLHDLTVRMKPYWRQILEPELQAGRRVLVIAHGNALRALMHLSTGMPLAQTARAQVATAEPITIETEFPHPHP